MLSEAPYAWKQHNRPSPAAMGKQQEFFFPYFVVFSALFVSVSPSNERPSKQEFNFEIQYERGALEANKMKKEESEPNERMAKNNVLCFFLLFILGW